MITDITMVDMLPGNMEPDNDMHVIMFFGATCGPCKATMPHYEKVSDFFNSKGARIKFYRINAWEPQEQKEYCSQTWGINGVPNFKIFFSGQIISERAGGGDEPTINKFILDGIDEVFKKFGERL